jgi:transcriptional regulator with XRE-family HTH domain
MRIFLRVFAQFVRTAVAYPESDIILPMNWMEIRAHYAALHAQARAAGLTQKAIADRGGLSGQNAISKLLANTCMGPSVETFVRALHGLGKDVSTFFAELEQKQVPAASSLTTLDASILQRLEHVERTLAALSVSLSSSAADSSHLISKGTGVAAAPVNHDRRPHGGHLLSGTGVIAHISTADTDSVTHEIKAGFEVLASLLRGTLGDVGTGDDPHGDVHPATAGASRARAAHRRRSHKGA